jgi:hypothetical protein
VSLLVGWRGADSPYVTSAVPENAVGKQVLRVSLYEIGLEEELVSFRRKGRAPLGS